MKRKLACTIILLFSSVCIWAQQHYTSNIAIGVKGGTTISKQMFSPTVEQSFLVGYMGGVTFRYIEEKHFGLIVECNLEQRGWKETFDNTPYSFNRTLSYIQIPFLAHVYFGSDKFRFFFNAGPEMGILINEKTNANYDIYNIGSISDFPSKNRYTEQQTMPLNSKFDYGISAGLGMEWQQNKRNSFTLEGRFYYGLNNIFSAHKSDTFAASNGISILVSLGYMFRIK